MFDNILYTAIFYNDRVLFEYNLNNSELVLRPSSEQIKSTSVVILNKMDISINNKLSYIYNDLVYSLIIYEKLIIISVSPEKYSNNMSFEYLDNLKKYLVKNNYNIWEYKKLSNEEFFSVNGYLYKLSTEYNDIDNKDKCDQIKIEIDETKSVMLHNIDQIISRGEKLELLMDKSHNLNTHSYTFKKRAKKLRIRMCCKSIGMTLFFILFIIAIIYVMLSFICGFNFSKC